MFKSKLTDKIQMLNKKPRKKLRDNYKSWVKKQHCLITGEFGVDPHHLRNLNGLTGMALTPTDEYCVPLSRLKHTEVHSPNPSISFQEKYSIDLELELLKLHAIFVKTMVE